MKKFILFTLSVFFTFSFLNAQTTILNFEDMSSSTLFQYFGSTLDGATNSVIDNPDASGINTSSRVADFTKPAGSEVWAGAFSVDNVTVDLTSDNQICVKVWSGAVGNLALKLEMSTTGGDDWITTQPIDETETWVELCFNTGSPSMDPPFTTAVGNSYQRVVLFFDFGESLAEERVYYFDDIVSNAGAAQLYDVTFSVDMNEYSGGQTIETVYVSGSFNDWAGDANPLGDDDGDGVWEGTVTGIEAGAIEYKFQINAWADQEQFNGGEDCTITDPSGQFVNRAFDVTGTTTLETVCFASCDACMGGGDMVNITINLAAGGGDPANGFFIAGGGNFGDPGANPLTDDDGDGIYTITLQRPAGFESFYTFTNGACPDYSCKENIAGQACANPDNFNDRKMGPVNEDIVINTCFGQCTETTECGTVASPGAITFSVDMNGHSGDFTTVYISGNFNSWSGDANPLTDDDGDGIYTTTIAMNAGPQEYKFQLDAWTVQEEFMPGGECTLTTGEFTNRLVEVDGDADVCFIWNTCTACDINNVFEVEVDNTIFDVQPTIVTDEVLVTFGDQFTDTKQLKIINTIGQVVKAFEVDSNISQQTINLSHLDNGIYFVNIQTEGKLQTRRIIIQH